LAIAAWVIGFATTVGFVGAAGFAGCAAELVLVVGIAAETLSSGASAIDEASLAAVFDGLIAVAFVAFGDSVTGVLLADFAVALVAFAADDDVVVELFTVAVFVAVVFAFGFDVSALGELFPAVFTGAFATSTLALLTAFTGAFFAGAAFLTGAAFFAGATFFAAAFIGGAAFFTGAAFFAAVAFAGAAFLAADFTEAAFEAAVFVVLVFLALDVAALGMRSTSQAVQAAPP
jgi:hypothetical protein